MNAALPDDYLELHLFETTYKTESLESIFCSSYDVPWRAGSFKPSVFVQRV
jgi:hypothetical protein